MLFWKDYPMTIRYKIIQFQSKVLDSIDAVNCYDYMASILDELYVYEKRAPIAWHWKQKTKHSERKPKVYNIKF